jgi:hypothetical protein
MGLFNSLFGSREKSDQFTPQESFAGILFGASACDGHIAEEEFQSLVTTLMRMKLFERFDSRKFNQMMDKLQQVLTKKGVDFLIDDCVEALPGELSTTVYANACDVILSDRVVEPDEMEFMDNLQVKLGLDADTAKQIASVMVVKNKG